MDNLTTVDDTKESSETNVTNFFDLNDDCLMQIFKDVNDIDLASLVEADKRFEESAREVFRKKYGKKDFFVYIREATGYINKLRCILQHFGHLIPNLPVYTPTPLAASERNYKISELIRHYCSKTVVSMQFVSVQSDVIKAMIKQCPKLEKLHFGCAKLENAITDFWWCPNLRQIEFSSLNIDNPKFIQRPFRHLTNFSAHSVQGLTDANLDEFFQCNSQLKILNLVFCNQLTLKAFECMDDKLNELEVLNLTFSLINNQTLPTSCKSVNLKSLRNITITGHTRNSIILTSIACGNDKLEQVDLNGCAYNDELINAICFFKQITILELKGPYITDDYILTLGKNLPKIEILKLLGTTVSVTSSGIIDFIRQCERLYYLSIFCRLENPNINLDSKFHKEFSQIVQHRDVNVVLEIEVCKRKVKITNNGIFENYSAAFLSFAFACYSARS